VVERSDTTGKRFDHCFRILEGFQEYQGQILFLCDPAGINLFISFSTGGVASLNHRLTHYGPIRDKEPQPKILRGVAGSA